MRQNASKVWQNDSFELLLGNLGCVKKETATFLVAVSFKMY